MLKGLLLDSVRLFKNHYIGIALVILPIFIPVEIFNALYSNYFLEENSGFSEYLPPFLIGLLAYPIYSVGVIFYIASIIDGEPIDVKTSWKLGIKYWMPFLLLTIFVAFVVALGFLLFIVPGIVFIARYAFAEFELLLNKRLPVDSMRESWEATRFYVWKLLGGFLVITVVLYGPFFGFMAVFEYQQFDILVVDSALNIIYVVLGTLYTIFAFRVYHLKNEQHRQASKMMVENGS